MLHFVRILTLSSVCKVLSFYGYGLSYITSSLSLLRQLLSRYCERGVRCSLFCRCPMNSHCLRTCFCEAVLLEQWTVTESHAVEGDTTSQSLIMYLFSKQRDIQYCVQYCGTFLLCCNASVQDTRHLQDLKMMRRLKGLSEKRCQSIHDISCQGAIYWIHQRSLCPPFYSYSHKQMLMRNVQTNTSV